MRAPTWAVVVPSLGRPSLAVLLDSLAAQRRRPEQVVVVDDRPVADGALDVSVLPGTQVLAGGGRGPAHARNVGWHAVDQAVEWVVFVDDDVVLPAGWAEALERDLGLVDAEVAGVQAVLDVPLPADRRPTDWERVTHGLSTSSWITADMAYRRRVLAEVGGFDERFPRAFREDADLALRVLAAGHELACGRRQVVHPVRPSGPWASLRQQRGNADDALMRRLHGRSWRAAADAPLGRLPWHAATVAAFGTALVAALAGRRRPALAALAGWAALTGDFAWRRVAPGPRTGDEVRVMVATSVAIPFAAVAHRVAGEWRHRAAPPWHAPVRAVLFDRDGTLVHDVPYNGDPELVRPVDGAAEAVQRLRDKGIAVGVVTNQSGVGRGLLSRQQVDAVNARVDREVGPFDDWQICPHRPGDGCTCRKPGPTMVQRAARALGVEPHEVVVVGDIASDVEAARAAGGRGILVPNDATDPSEVEAAPARAATLGEAVDQILQDAP